MEAVNDTFPEFRFDESKATQMAACLISLAGDQINYMKLIKLMYLADRKAFEEIEQPISSARYVNMKNGPVLSQVLTLIKEKGSGSGEWSAHIERCEDYDVRLIADSEPLDLSEAEISILRKIFQEFGGLDKWDLVDKVCHKLPEWHNPEEIGKSVTDLNPDKILRAIGKSEDEIAAIAEEIDALNHFENLIQCAR